MVLIGPAIAGAQSPSAIAPAHKPRSRKCVMNYPPCNRLLKSALTMFMIVALAAEVPMKKPGFGPTHPPI